MRFYLLGDIYVIADDDQEVRLSSQQRALLAVLILASGQRADHQHITDHLWPSGGGSEMALRKCVSGLRRRLGDRVPRGEHGLVEIRVGREEVDYFRFVDGVRNAPAKPSEERAKALSRCG